MNTDTDVSEPAKQPTANEGLGAGVTAPAKTKRLAGLYRSAGPGAGPAPDVEMEKVEPSEIDKQVEEAYAKTKDDVQKLRE